MFTGIIKELGKVRAISGLGNVYKISVEAKDIAAGLTVGDSVAVNGACLTLAHKDKNILTFDVMAETMRKTNLGNLGPLDMVNLEDALRANSYMGGHFVTGHIDCIGKIKCVKNSASEAYVEISFPQEYKKFVVEKGSIAIEGISLTVGKVSDACVTIYIIPHTLKVTTLGKKSPDDTVNIEFDILGKYVAKRVFS